MEDDQHHFRSASSAFIFRLRTIEHIIIMSMYTQTADEVGNIRSIWHVMFRYLLPFIIDDMFLKFIKKNCYNEM